MAQFNKQILGQAQGAVGDITFRKRNGKTYLAAKPAPFTPGSDDKSVARRGKFSITIKFAKSINSIPLLKNLWQKDAPAGVTTFNHITRTNYAMIGSGSFMTALVRLTPSLGFNISNPVAVLGPNEIKVNLDAIGDSSGIDVLNESSIKLVSIVYLGNPTDASLKKYNFLTFVSDAKATDLSTALEFNTALDNVVTQMLTIYQERKAFFALVTLDSEGNVVHYSNTFAG